MSQQNASPSVHTPRSMASLATAPGSMSAEETRARASAQRRQLRHDNETNPRAPEPDREVEVWATAGERMPVGHATVFFTVDGSAPSETSPIASMESVAVEWDDNAGFLTRWRAVLPPQPAQFPVGG